MSYSRGPVDDDLKINPAETHDPARGWYEIDLDGKKGQTHKSLRDCFNEVGFDPDRPRQHFEEGHSGFSYYEFGDRAEVYVSPTEAQGIRNGGFTIKRM